MKDHVYLLRNNITAEICWQNALKFREKFARIKFMEFLSHVLVMYDCHILLHIVCTATVGNKHLKRILQNYFGFFLVCTADTCM